MTLLELLLVWNTSLIPHGGLEIVRIDDGAIVYIADANKFKFGCENHGENEIPYWEIVSKDSLHDLVPRRAHSVGWCSSLENKFRKIVRKSKSKKLRVFGYAPDVNLPPSLPGLNVTFHSIKNDNGNCVGHFVHACEETEEENWDNILVSHWALID